MESRFGLVPALVLAIGLTLCGWFVGKGFLDSRLSNRHVVVKGVSEREVEADIGFWPIKFVSTDDNLTAAQIKIKKSLQTVTEFLIRQGIDSSSIELQNLEVTDRLANQYGSGNVLSRYIITQSLIVRTKSPMLLKKASQKISQLVDAGVVLASNYGPQSSPIYVFTGLNTIKPEMIAEATANARKSAEQFAKDSQSKLGGIRYANQGIFVILPRNQAPGIMEENEYYKKVRVVTTLTYFLQD